MTNNDPSAADLAACRTLGRMAGENTAAAMHHLEFCARALSNRVAGARQLRGIMVMRRYPRWRPHTLFKQITREVDAPQYSLSELSGLPLVDLQSIAGMYSRLSGRSIFYDEISRRFQVRS